MTATLAATAFARFDELFPREGLVGLAVSGGSDSTALLHLASSWACDRDRALRVATVDHGLRESAAAEIAQVSSQAEGLGLRHAVLRVQVPAGGNLQARARAARYGALAAWARDVGAVAVGLGHTRDDQAETFLMRLARGSGLAGLAGMDARRMRDGVEFVRPLLTLGRAELRAWLSERSIRWSDDPTNDDPAHARTRARRALGHLSDLGIDAATIADTMARLRQADAVLGTQAAALARRLVRPTEDGTLEVSGALAEAAPELRHRVLAAAFRWFAPSEFPPRAARAADAYVAAAQGGTRTLGGVVVAGGGGGEVRMYRELSACEGIVRPGGAGAVIWDGRWRVEGDFTPDMTIGALGLSDWPSGQARPGGGARRWLAATPAIRRAGVLVAAPVVKSAPGWPVRLVPFAAR